MRALPGGVVVAIAAVWTLHSAVAGKEVTAHAQRVAVRLVLANELARLHCRDGHDEGPGGRVRDEYRVDLEAVVEAASGLGPIADSGKLSVTKNEVGFKIKVEAFSSVKQLQP